ncbi:MAG: hypothetical protein CM15mP103_04010 [Gammaproteobacteria bacterium]|nr:MAG: hypothetical protein CM15mP103_04010 [Gammaproteobacteria bacterium]
MIMPAISMMMFAGADPSYSQMVIAIVLLGVPQVSNTTVAYLVSRYFGVVATRAFMVRSTHVWP